MVNPLLEYDIRMLNCANLYYGIKTLMFTAASKSFSDRNELYLAEFEDKFFNHLKLLSYKAFQNNPEMYSGCSKLIEKTLAFNKSINDQGDGLIALIKNGLKGIDKNLAGLKKLLPKKGAKKGKSRGKSAEKKYFSRKHKHKKSGDKDLDENNINTENQHR
jgi:hypothetical protein